MITIDVKAVPMQKYEWPYDGQAQLLLSLDLSDMTDGKMQPSKGHSKGIFKGVKKWLTSPISRFPIRSTSLQPSASEQENRGGELSSVQHTIASSGRQWIYPVNAASAAPSQLGIFHVSL